MRRRASSAIGGFLCLVAPVSSLALAPLPSSRRARCHGLVAKTPTALLHPTRLATGQGPLSSLVAPAGKRVLRRGTGVATRAAAVPTTDGSSSTKGGKFSLDVPLLLYFFFWYLGNYYYNISNKIALNAAGGAAGFPMTIATLQLAVGALYAAFLWVAPDSRPFPKTTLSDIAKLLPVAFCAAGAHASSVFALSAGAVSFGQIVKAAEPAFAAVLGTLFYGKKISKAKWLCLIPVIGGVILASLKELDFAVSALVAASVANLFAAVKANENKKCMEAPGLKDRVGSVGNQFALTTILALIFSIPVVLLREGAKLGEFATLWAETPSLQLNTVASGLWFYGYNELATMTIKKTSAVTQSVANTAKRVIVIVGVALVLGEALPPLKLLGCTIGIGGVFLYSLADVIWKKKDPESQQIKKPAVPPKTTTPRGGFLKQNWPWLAPVVGAVALALLTQVDFAVSALVASSVANLLRFLRFLL